MKQVSLFLATAVFSFFTASAQMNQGMHDQPHQGMGMMSNQGMMGNYDTNYDNMGVMMHGNRKGMMNRGIVLMQQCTFMVNMIPQMQNQLGLTTVQSNKLIDLRTTYLKQQIDLQAELSKKELKLEKLIEENAPADMVKTNLERYAQIQTNLELTAYQSGLEMRKILDDSQQKKFDKLMLQCFNGNCMMGNLEGSDNTEN
jgi:regulation of enolase protein 1 (concanavalin A-like superfamily)